jgi:TrmH family RNA methyltransferase
MHGGAILSVLKTTMEIISSRSNPKIKSARALSERKHRDAEEAFLVEGIHHVGAAIEAKATVERIFYAPEMLKSKYALDLIVSSSKRGIPSYATTEQVFISLTGRENPQGLLAVVSQPQDRLSDLNPVGFSWGVACVAPQDPGNVGTILRTIDAVGASGLVLLDGGVDPYHPTAVRASMGAIFRHPVVKASFAEFNKWVDHHEYRVYGTSAHGDVDFHQIDSYTPPLILLMGDERQGLTPAQAGICQALLRLPMHGEVTSLNLSVAAGVMLYDMLEELERN